MTPDTITNVLQDILTACTDAYGEVGAPTVPSRQFITHGQPVWVGEQLTVASAGVSSTHPFPLAQLRAIKTTVVPSLLVQIEVVRTCWPVPHVTSPAKLNVDPSEYTRAALLLAEDAATVFSYVTGLIVDGLLVPSLSSIGHADDFQVGQMTPTGPLGDKAGWRWPMAVKLAVP